MTMFVHKKIVVTGGAVRIGKSIAEAFSTRKGFVSVHCNTSFSEAEILCSSLPYPAEVCRINFADTDTETLRFLVKDADILINNASVYFPDGSFDVSEKKIIDKKHLLINYEIPLRLMELFAEENNSGCIINILDARCLRQDDSADNYYQSKFLLYKATLKKALAFAPQISVNGVAPGTVLPPSFLPDSDMTKSIAKMPLKKLPTVESIAAACVFLAGNDGITGEVIKVDGGLHLLSDSQP